MSINAAFTSLEDVQSDQPSPTCEDNTIIRTSDQPRRKQPRRILHFSDGILEEYSTDEEEETHPEPQVNTRELKWAPWFQFYLVYVGRLMLWSADACGSRLAGFLGITSPKYQYMLDEVYRQRALEAADREEQAAELRCREEVAMRNMEEAPVQTTAAEGQ